MDPYDDVHKFIQIPAIAAGLGAVGSTVAGTVGTAGKAAVAGAQKLGGAAVTGAQKVSGAIEGMTGAQKLGGAAAIGMGMGQKSPMNQAFNHLKDTADKNASQTNQLESETRTIARQGSLNP